MTIQDLKNQFQDELSSQYTAEEIDTIFYILAEKYLRKDKSIIRAGLHESWAELTSSKMLFNLALMQLKSGTPYQYVVGETEFFGHKIFVNSDVLIPRPETEELVEWIKTDTTSISSDFDGNILDIGTGSGAIAIALKKAFPKASVHALDISEKALETAKNNALYNHTEIHFHLIDILNTDLKELPFFDIIVSNPPYIPVSEKEKMQVQVTDFEPNNALFVSDENPIEFYEKISYLAQDKLKPKGCVYVETHQDFMEETKKMYEYGFAKVWAKKDLSNNWRMLKAQQPYSCK